MPSRQRIFVFFVVYHLHIVKSQSNNGDKDSEYSNVTFPKMTQSKKIVCLSFHWLLLNIG